MKKKFRYSVKKDFFFYTNYNIYEMHMMKNTEKNDSFNLSDTFHYDGTTISLIIWNTNGRTTRINL